MEIYDEFSEDNEPTSTYSSVQLECRTCGKNTDKYVEIYSEEGISHNIAEKINEHLPIKIHENDPHPLQCCNHCIKTLLEWHTFVLNCIEANVKFKNEPFDSVDKIEDVEVILNEEKEDSSEDTQLTNDEIVPSPKADPKVRVRRPSSAITYSFFCDVCDKGFTRKHGMEIHVKNYHPEAIQEVVKKPPFINYKVEVNNKILYQCDICNKTFKNASNVKRHKVTHTNEKTYCCHLCAATFGTSSSLNRHILNFHNGGKKISCEVCDKLFKTKDSLEAHKNIHLNKRPYVCEICGKSFKQAGGLHTHKIFHDNIFPHKCKVCDKKFRRLQDLKLHMLVHTGDKPYKCENCEKKFRTKYQLNKHCKKHLDKI